MTAVALDACAMIAYIDGEPGGDVVAGLLLDPNVTCYAHALNLCEVYYQVFRKSDAATARRVLDDLRADGVMTRRDLSQGFLRAVGALKASGKIALPDCFCITLAQHLGGEVVTSDHGEFDRLVPLTLCPIRFIR